MLYKKKFIDKFYRKTYKWS